MTRVHVTLSPWAAAQTVLDVPLATWWTLLATQAGVVLDDAAAVSIDGGRLDVDAPTLRAIADGGALPPGTPVTDLVGLRDAEAALLRARVDTESRRGVRFVGAPALVAPTVLLTPGCTVHAGVHLLGHTTVAAGAVIHAGCWLRDTSVGEGVELAPYTVCEGARVGARAHVGPFARLRSGTVLGADTKVGNFVETKNTTLADGAKANHLTYLGDATVGARSNVGAGTITCNYDGAEKHPTVIGADVFVGTNSALVAPLRIGDGALIAAGSVVTRDVEAGALAITRADERHLPGTGAAVLARNHARKAARKKASS